MSAESQALLIESVNTFGRQLHLPSSKSIFIHLAENSHNTATQRSQSQPLPIRPRGTHATAADAHFASNPKSTGASPEQLFHDAEACGHHSTAGSDSFFDAVSEGGTSVSSRTASDCSFDDGFRRMRGASANLPTPSLEEAISTTDWQAMVVEEKQRRQIAENAISELRHEYEQLTACIASLEAAHRDEVAALRREAAASRAAAESAADAARDAASGAVQAASVAFQTQALVASIVADIMGRIVARDEADAAYSTQLRLLRQHKALLQQRVDRLSRMSTAVDASAAQSALAQQHRPQVTTCSVALAACCSGLGVACALLLASRLHRA